MAQPSPPLGDDVPRRFGPYEVAEALPGDGWSFRAHDTRRDRTVALHLLPRELVAGRAAADRFHERLSLVAGLADPHVVPVHDFGVVAGWPFVDTRLVDGEPLTDVLRRDGPLAPERAVRIVAQVADALDAAHRAGLVHGALGPGSVAVGPHDFAHVTDLSAEPRRPRAVPYPAPEQLAGDPVDLRTDVHALASLLAELLTGSAPRRARPFVGRDLRHGRTAAVVPEALGEVVARGRAARPEDRFPTAGALAAAATAALAGTAPPPPAAVPLEQEPPGHRRRWVPLVVAATAAALVVGLVVAVTTDTDRTTGAGAAVPTAASPAAPTTVSPSAPPAPAVPAASRPDPQLGPAVPAGRQPHEVVLAPDGRTAWVPDPAAGTVLVVDPATAATTATVAIPEGPPQMVTFSPDGDRAYVSVFDKGYSVNRIDVVDTAQRRVLQSIPVGRGPYAASTTPDGRLLYVPLFAEAHLDVVDTAGGAVVGRVDGAANPHWIVFRPDGTRAWTANHFSGVVTVLDEPGDRVATTVRVGDGPHSVELSPDGRQLAVADYVSGQVTLVDTATEAVTATVPVGKGPQDVSYAPDGRHLYTADVDAGTVSVVDTATGTLTAQLAVGKSPTSVAVLPDGRTALVSDFDDGTIRLLRTG